MPVWMKAWMLLPIGVATLAGGLVWMSHMRYELSLEAQRVKTEQKVIGLESSRLRLEVANLIRPERLRQYAVNQLDMAAPKPRQVVRP